MQLKVDQALAGLSGKGYRDLSTQLKRYDETQLWKVLDHYILHYLNDEDAYKLLGLLKEFEDGEDPEMTPVYAQEESPRMDRDAGDDEGKRGFVLPKARPSDGAIESVDVRPDFDDTIEGEDLESSKGTLDLFFDRTFFRYLRPDSRKSAAAKLIKFSKDQQTPIQPHWIEYAEEAQGGDVQ